MDTKALRQKILDLAIRGKLVPQNPNDEPASVLLERIRAEKQRMVKEGKLKAKDVKNDTIIFKGEDNLHYEKFHDGTVKCIEGEIPFEVPEGWEWCRLNDLFSVRSAKRVLQSDWETEGVPFYRAREIVKLAENGTVENELFISEEHYQDMTKNYGIPHENDLMVSAVGTIGKIYIVKKQDRFYYKDASVICFQNIYNIINSEYAKIMLESPFLQHQMKKNSKGTTVDTITISTAQTYLCVLPPLKEQISIVIAVEKMLALVDVIKESKNGLKHLIDNAKSKILDLVIRGQLVPQSPDDVPASVLLKKICAEKKELIKQGKIKRDKRESIIFRGDDNSYYQNNGDTKIDISDKLPFIIPDSWCWGELKDIVIINPRNKLDDDAEVAFVPMPSIEDGYSGSHTSEIRKWKEVKTGFTHFMEGDIGVAKITPCFENRKSVIFKNLYNGYGAGTTELHVLRPYRDTILPEYLLAYVKTNQFIENGKKTFSGAVGQQRIGKEYIEKAYFPIPPIKEQHRIVKQLNNLFGYLNKMTAALS